MSASEALLNLAVSLITLLPLMLFSWWIIRKTPVQGLTGVAKWRAYRIRIAASAMIFLGAALMLYFLLNWIAALFPTTPTPM